MLIAAAMMLEALRTMENPVESKTERPPTTLFQFDEGTEPWRIIDDGVMGGVSQGNWRVEEGVGIFSGTLSLENNGGFSSVRSQPVQESCDGAQSVRLRVKGDGRRYQFRIRTSNAFDGPSYRHHFDTTKDEWTTIELPLKDFEASFRGRVLPNQPPLEGKDIVTVGFLLADKKPGPFRLEVDWIETIEGTDTPQEARRPEVTSTPPGNPTTK